VSRSFITCGKHKPNGIRAGRNDNTTDGHYTCTRNKKPRSTHFVYVGFEDVHLGAAVLGHLVHQPFHVLLEVQSKRFLVRERVCFHQTVVEHNVHTAFQGFVGALGGLFGGRVGAVDMHVAQFARDQLAVHLVQDAIDQFELVGVREHLVTGENVFEDLHYKKLTTGGAEIEL